MTSPNSWTTLMDATRLGAVGRLTFDSADFSALDNDTFIDVVRCHGLHTLTINGSAFPPGFVADDLIRSSAAQGLHQLCVFENSFDGPHRFSDGAILDFFFREGAVPAAQSLSLEIEGIGLTDMFLINVFEVSRLVAPAFPRYWRTQAGLAMSGKSAPASNTGSADPGRSAGGEGQAYVQSPPQSGLALGRISDKGEPR